MMIFKANRHTQKKTQG